MPQKQESTDLATDFLKQFLRTLIKQTKTAKFYKFEQEIPLIKEVSIKGNFVIEDEAKADFKNYLAEKIPEPPKQRDRDFLSQNIPAQQTSKMPAVYIPLQIPQPQSQNIEAGLEKINKILSDSAVQSIECSGPDKNITANKSGRIETIPITLTKEEISKITQFFSEKTKIPLVTGVFRANLANLSITAIISDFVGTRFILQKRMSF